jgi:adenylate cyclase
MHRHRKSRPSRVREPWFGDPWFGLCGTHGLRVAGGAEWPSLVGNERSSDRRRGSVARPDEPGNLTFVFADIAGFTALTEAHGDEQAARLVADFCGAVDAELPGARGRQVKTIGDAVMLTVPEPAAAILLGLRITHELMREHGAPAVRVGLHHGPAIERDGDYFGAAVNLAARVSAEASGGEVLLTGHTAALAPELDGVFYEPRGRRALRNVREPVELFAATRTGESGHRALACDPVCRMAVDPDRAAGRLMYEGAAYFFCTLACAGEFASHPERFAREEA